MVSLQKIEQDLTVAIKARNQIAADTLRALKTRVQNEQIAKMKDLGEDDIIALVQSEIKRRKEAADSFKAGGRQESADKELAEVEVLSVYLPLQASEADIAQAADGIIAEHGFMASDFGKAMGLLKAKFGNTAEGSVLARVLKEKLKPQNT